MGGVRRAMALAPLAGLAKIAERLWVNHHDLSRIARRIAIAAMARWACFALCLALGVTGCTQAGNRLNAMFDASFTHNYPVSHSLNMKRDGIDAMPGTPHWLDNHRVIFTAFQRWRPEGPHIDEIGNPVVVWHVDEDRLVRHMQGTVKCVDSVTGYVQIDSKPREKIIPGVPRQYLQGGWGNDGSALSTYDYYLGEKKPDDYFYMNVVSCRVYRGSEFDRIKPGFIPKPLREEHGFLYWDRSDKTATETTFFHNAQTGKETSFRHLRSHFQGRDPIYVPWANEYLLSGLLALTNELDSIDPVPIRRLKLDGSIELIDPPAFLWAHALRGSLKVLPYRHGLIWRFKDRYLGQLATGLEGIYVQGGTRYVRVSYPGEWAISPNGCRLLVKETNGFEILELCKGE